MFCGRAPGKQVLHLSLKRCSFKRQFGGTVCAFDLLHMKAGYSGPLCSVPFCWSQSPVLLRFLEMLCFCGMLPLSHLISKPPGAPCRCLIETSRAEGRVPWPTFRDPLTSDCTDLQAHFAPRSLGLGSYGCPPLQRAFSIPPKGQREELAS